MERIICSEARERLDSYLAALAAFHHSQKVFLTGIPLKYPDARRARERKNEAFELLLRTRKAYWLHIKKHGCRERACSAASIRTVGESPRAVLQWDAFERPVIGKGEADIHM